MQPQQSLRTFFNRTREGAPYVKVALAIQNMGFLRGLSPHYMRDTPAINDWLAALVAGDAEFSDQGFRVRRERAAIGYTGDAYHRTRTTNPHRKMLAALWREYNRRLGNSYTASLYAGLCSLLDHDEDLAGANAVRSRGRRGR